MNPRAGSQRVEERSDHAVETSGERPGGTTGDSRRRLSLQAGTWDHGSQASASAALAAVSARQRSTSEAGLRSGGFLNGKVSMGNALIRCTTHRTAPTGNGPAAFPLVRAIWVGATGFEPVTSSVSRELEGSEPASAPLRI
jgi:hypothetical protein